MADQVFSALTRTIIASPLPEASWFSAAEAALAALYTLHPAPEQLAAAVLRHMAGRAFRSRAVEAAVAAAEEEEGAQVKKARQRQRRLQTQPPAACTVVCKSHYSAAPAVHQCSCTLARQGQASEVAARCDCPRVQEGGEEPSLSGVSGAAGQGAAKYSVSTLSRFFFVLGHIALLHLVS